MVRSNVLFSIINGLLNRTPWQPFREPTHEVSPRGQGNVVSVEFNLLYRWHAALSREDTKWTEDLFEEVFNTRDFGKVRLCICLCCSLLTEN